MKDKPEDGTVAPTIMKNARWAREWPDPNCEIVQWPYGYAEIHGSRFGRKNIAFLIEQLYSLYVDAMKWRAHIAKKEQK